MWYVRGMPTAVHLISTIPGAPESDPNTVAPSAARMFKLDRVNDMPGAPVCWQACKTGGCKTQLWAYEPRLSRWIKVNGESTVVVDVLHVENVTGKGTGDLSISGVPRDMDLFLQITDVGTTTAIVFGVM